MNTDHLYPIAAVAQPIEHIVAMEYRDREQAQYKLSIVMARRRYTLVNMRHWKCAPDVIDATNWNRAALRKRNHELRQLRHERRRIEDYLESRQIEVRQMAFPWR